MKKVILTLCVMGISLFSVANEVNPFDKVLVNAQTRVRVIQGTEYKVDVLAADTITEKSVKVEVKDSILKINSNENLDNVVVVITTPEEPTIEVGKMFEVAQK